MVRLAILWHMHQPYYEDPATGEHILPWVRLHAIKDYWGMVNLLEEFPGVRVTFNLVPSLLVQVQAFAEDRARDRHLELGLKPAAELSPDERDWMVANGFHAPYGRMIAPYPRYRELHVAKHSGRAFEVDELRDLQIWHKLAWMDPDLLARDRRLLALIEKGSHYTESDKVALREVELETLRDVIPAYRRAADRGHVELSTSPFYHPILPLLCDSDIHLRAHPQAARPGQRFVRPDDARTQIVQALDFHRSVFGKGAAGMWPSEGSVSDEAVALIGHAGLQWIATDEDILSRSLGVGLPRDSMGHAERPDVLYRAYRVGAGDAQLSCLFRDHALSDRVGFLYQSWDADAAATDFVERVREAGRRFKAATGEDDAIVSVILDGENAWEHYAAGGRPFLRSLYGQLERADDIQTVTMAEAGATPSGQLSDLFPGSWINSDFSIWIGHRDDQRAWTQLAEARNELDSRAGVVSEEARSRAFLELQIAEGSDWFWWYGDDHSSDHDRDFDDLFRRHIRNAYDALASPPPAELFQTNITTSPAAPEPTVRPVASASPMFDGLDTSALEWVSAARAAQSSARAGTMHQISGTALITGLRLALDDAFLYLRLAGDGVSEALRKGESRVTLLFPEPTARSLEILPEWIAVDQITEIRVPRGALATGSDPWTGRLAITVSAEADRLLERHPHEGFWLVLGPPKSTARWIV